MSVLNAAMTNMQSYLFIGYGVMIFVLIILVFIIKMDLSDMQRRYKKMMAGASGEDLETLLTRSTDEIARFSTEQRDVVERVRRIDDLLAKAITRVAVVKFNAFADTTSDMSYCVALLDDNNSGVIISAINGRDESRSYAKPIENGSSEYKLTKEEEQALREASGTMNNLKGGKFKFGKR